MAIMNPMTKFCDISFSWNVECGTLSNIPSYNLEGAEESDECRHILHGKDNKDCHSVDDLNR